MSVRDHDCCFHDAQRDWLDGMDRRPAVEQLREGGALAAAGQALDPAGDLVDDRRGEVQLLQAAAPDPLQD